MSEGLHPAYPHRLAGAVHSIRTSARAVSSLRDFLRGVADGHPALEQQLFNVTKAELKPKIPARCTTDDGCRKTMTVVERFRFLHHAILRARLHNVTMPLSVTPRTRNNRENSTGK